MNWSGSLVGVPKVAPYIEALRLALIERIKGGVVTGGFVGEEMTEQQVGMLHRIGTTTAPIAIEFQFLLNKVIPLFLNHHTEDDWADSVDPPVAWTEASLMAHLGQERIVLDGASRLMTAAWLKQQYDIINQLRWASRGAYSQSWGNSSGAAPDPFTGSRVQAGAGGASLSAAQTATASAFAAATPALPGGHAPSRVSFHWQTAEDPDLFAAQLISVVNSFRGSVHRDYHCAVHYYFNPSTPTYLSHGIPGDFEGDGLGDVNLDVWNYAGSNISTKDPGESIQVWSPYIGNPAAAPWPSAAPDIDTAVIRGWTCFPGSARLVAKYDQDPTDGFQFLP